MRLSYLGVAIVIFSLIICVTENLVASTNVMLNPLPGYDFADTTSAETKFKSFPDLFFSKNKNIIPTAFAMLNPIGYPNGKSAIKAFPHLEFGIAAGGGVLEYKRKDDYTDTDPSIPFGGFNGGFHLGTGITDKIDVTFKVFIFSLEWISSFDQSFEGEGLNTSYSIEIDDSEILSFGMKARYNLAKRMVIYPVYLAFGGISLNMGFDYMKGKMESAVEFVDTQSVETVSSGALNITADITGEPSIKWQLYTATTEAFVYFDFVYYFSLYTGPSVSFNYGFFNFDVDGTGTLNVDTAPLGDIYLRSRNHMEPKLVIPKWTVGLEINIMSLKLQLEGSAILTSITDSILAQIGARIQI